MNFNLPDRIKTTPLVLLTAIFLTIGFLASGIAFFYPLEIETRESTVWLCVLASQQGINIYDHSRVAFVNMNHGPFDPLFKFAVATMFPFLESWQVTRFAVFLLPFVFLFVTFKLAGKSPGKTRLNVLFLAATGYLFLLLSAKDVILLGRSDATVAVLFLLLAYASTSFAPGTKLRAGIHGFICGVLGTSVMLTNWRAVPPVIAVLLFALWTYRQTDRAPGKLGRYYALSCIGASLVMSALILHYLFDFNLTLYYKHFFGFYSHGAGWVSSNSRGLVPFGDSYDHSMFSFLKSLFYPAADTITLKGGPLLLALVAYLFIPRKADSANKAWSLLSLSVLAFCVMAYYLQFYGGGPHYFVPFFILLWFFLCRNFSRMAPARLTLLGVCMLALVCINYRTVLLPTLKRGIKIQRAYDFMTSVRSLQDSNTILSEDTFLFRRSRHGESIDMGDTVSAFRRTGYYGDEFNKTVDRHFERTKSDPPDYVLTGFTESPELRSLIEENYVLVAEGPHNLTANGGTSSRLFKRKTLIAD